MLTIVETKQSISQANVGQPATEFAHVKKEQIKHVPIIFPVSRVKLIFQSSCYYRQAWDLALDLCLRQLPRLFEDDSAVFQHSPFFTEQLTAFDVWLQYGTETRLPPEQLPIVLQVLLSQVHRLRALELLGRFLDLGPWAVSLVRCVHLYGIANIASIIFLLFCKARLIIDRGRPQIPNCP